MTLDAMDVEKSNGLGIGTASMTLVEDPAVLNAFADSLYQFKQNAETTDLFSIVKSFREVSTSELLNLLESNVTASDSTGEKDVAENWLLETKFWNLVEVLIGFRYSNEYNEHSSMKIDEFTSHAVIKDQILANNTSLRELDFVSYWLIHNFNLDDDDQDVSGEDLPSTKWLNTKIDLQSNFKKPDLVSSLDPDATLRNNQANKRSRKINEKDAKNDLQFFKVVFKLLLEEKHDEIMELCESTNNWTLASIIAGANDYIDPEIDGSALHGGDDEDDDDSMGLESRKPTGIKNKILWRRAVYALSMNPNLSKYERGIYSFLSGDHVGLDLTSSWERQLLILTNNVLQYDLEKQLINYLDPAVFGKILKLSKPDKKFQSINEILNYLSHSPEEAIRKQSSHSIRVLIGSIITNNVDQLISNSINLLDELVLANDKFRNNSTLSTKNTNNLIKESYLLRILIHFIIFMKFLNDSIISDENLVKLIKLYITRLSLYKLYELIPIYISYIPSHSEIVENYSFFLSTIIIDKDDRLNQLKHMRTLELPLEDILKKTVARIFEDTEPYYQHEGSIEFNTDYTSKLDLKLIGSINWFLDSNMLADCVESTIALSRRFLINGKLQSLIQLYEAFEVQKVVNEYKIEKDIMDDFYNEANDENEIYDDPNLNIEEISQYQLLIHELILIEKYENSKDNLSSLKLASKVIESVYPLIKNWLVLAISMSENTENIEFYQALRSLYLPFLLFKMLSIIKAHETSELLKEFKKLIIIISSEQYQVYAILKETNNLKEVLAIIADISTDAFNNFDNGIYD